MPQGLDGDRIRSISQRTKSVLNWLVLILTASVSQVEAVVIQGENALRILDPRQELVPLVGTMHGQMGTLPLLLGVGEGDGSLHDDVE